MIEFRPSDDRGRFDHGWLDTRHTFSFADYHDPRHMGFRSLRVINEDVVAPGAGFPTHPHRDMEILTVVLEGSIEHRDSMGHTSVLLPGEVQRMTAGTGLRHSEANPSPKDRLHLYQIWILPERNGLEPGYEQKEFPGEERKNRLRLLASREGREGSLTIHQDAALLGATLERGKTVVHRPAPGRHAWVQVARGTVTLNGRKMAAGDGAAASGERELAIAGMEPAEILVFDLA